MSSRQERSVPPAEAGGRESSEDGVAPVSSGEPPATAGGTDLLSPFIIPMLYPKVLNEYKIFKYEIRTSRKPGRGRFQDPAGSSGHETGTREIEEAGLQTLRRVCEME